MRIGKNNKLYATGFVKPKTTSLFFDNIWLPEDMIVKLNDREKQWIHQFCTTTDFGNEAYKRARVSNSFRATICGEEKGKEIEYYSSYHRNMSIKQYSESIKRRFNVDVVPIYLEPTQFDIDNNHSNFVKIKAIQLCIDNFPIVDEENLEWEQVRDFRIQRYNERRRFYLWSLDEFKEKSNEEIIYGINKELDEFKHLLKKHGILTSIGGFTAILAASSTLISSIESGLLNQIGAGLTITCGLITYTTQQVINYAEVRRNPIAYIYDIEKKLR